MKAHSQGPRCLPWSLKASKNEWGCILLNGNIWGNLPWNLLVNRQVWSMGHISIRKCASDLSLAACVPGNSLGTCKTHTCGSADRGQGRGVPHTPTHGSLSSSPAWKQLLFLQKGSPRVHRCWAAVLWESEGWIWETWGASNLEVRMVSTHLFLGTCSSGAPKDQYMCLKPNPTLGNRFV